MYRAAYSYNASTMSYYTNVLLDGSHDQNLMNCESGSLNLTDGGVLQVCRDNEWLAVCGLYFAHASAAVSCRQLGYDSGYDTFTYSISEDEIDTVHYRCTGQERTLADCSHEDASSCSRGIRIACMYKNESDPCSSGEMRLRGGATENEGQVELCTQYGVWSAVSYLNWGQADAVVACRQLGKVNHFAIPTQEYRTADQPIEFGGYGCRGTESSLSECTVYSSYINYIGLHNGYAALKCISNGSVCTEGDVRLVNGYSENNGIVELCINGVWMGACVGSYGPIITTTVCKQLGYTRGARVDTDFFPMNEEVLAYVSLYYYYCSSPTYSPISCVYGSSNFGFSFYESCSIDNVLSVLCCGNDTKACSFGSATPEPVPDSAYYQLHFGDSAAQLVMSSFTDLRGLEKDIHTRIVSDVSTNCNCNFNSASLGEGNFLFGEGLTYRGVLFEMDGHYASSLVEMLSKSIHKQPLIKYQHGDIYLSISANCSVSIESLTDPEC